MPKTKIFTSIGLMSGTSMDGIDVSLIKSDGKNIKYRGLNIYFPYDSKLKNRLKKLITKPTVSLSEIKEVELELTKQHIDAVFKFVKATNIDKKEVDLIGFHGQTILHNADKKISWQIGNAYMLAAKTGIDVVADFRSKDIVFGGQGAPLVPIYHMALFKDLNIPALSLNIGGIANIAYIEDDNPDNLIAFDVCYGNAPLDDLVQQKTNDDYDSYGSIAAKGEVNQTLVDKVLEIKYFSKKPPKSLDRNQLHNYLRGFEGVKLEDALTSLNFAMAKIVVNSLKYFPKTPKFIAVCGGGRKNLSIIKHLRSQTDISIIDVDHIGYDGDFVESEAFAFLAIRSVLNLPISYPKTTGVLSEKHGYQASQQQCPSSCGGVFYPASPF